MSQGDDGGDRRLLDTWHVRADVRGRRTLLLWLLLWLCTVCRCLDDCVTERRLAYSAMRSVPHWLTRSSTRQTDCLLESRPYCDLSSSRCASCREDSDCGSSAPFCLAGEEVTVDGTTRPTPARCVQCRNPGSTEDCHIGLTCNSLNYCASCSSNEECPKDRPVCSTDTRSCVQCDERAGLSCPKERPICHFGRCLGCESDADCGNVLRCDPNTNRCELCVTHQVRDSLLAHMCHSVTHPATCCSTTGLCDHLRRVSAVLFKSSSVSRVSQRFRLFVSGTCGQAGLGGEVVAASPSSATNQNTHSQHLRHLQFPHCDQSSGTCVQCSPLLPCELGGVCNQGRCVDCIDSSQCSQTLPVCDLPSGRCIECREQGDCPAGLGCFEGLCKECDASTTAVCSSVIQKYHQSCSSQLTCESTVEFGSTASVLGVS